MPAHTLPAVPVVRSTAVIPGARTRRSRARDAVVLIRTHAAFAAVLLVGVTVRILTMVAYPPALFFGDSWGYIVGAFGGHPIAISNIRVSGYSALIRLFTLPSRDLVQLVAAQHLAGLAIGTLVYVALVRASVPRLGAAAAAALVLLDGYAITLEQHVMSETFFTLTLLGAALLLAWAALRGDDDPDAGGRTGPGDWRVVAVAGLLLAGTVLQRAEGLFVVPVFLAYVVWSRVGWRTVAAFVLALAIPVLAYATLEDSRFGSFGLTQSSGWTLYGRVAGFADCRGAGMPADAQPLCETPLQRRSHPDAPTWYIFAPISPAGHMFGGYGKSAAAQAHSNAVLGTFARRIVVHQPLEYVRAVGGDVLRFFTPGVTQFDDAVSATTLPATASGESVVQDVRNRYLPNMELRVQSPSALVRGYRGIVHVPRPVLALLAIASAAALLVTVPRRREVLLLSGSAVALLLGTAATAGFGLRYMLPAVPLLAIGGTLATHDLWRRRSASGGAVDRR
jgi:Dolichyl-phosphate-mannose-protein mannosyltransferase